MDDITHRNWLQAMAMAILLNHDNDGNHDGNHYDDDD